MKTSGRWGLAKKDRSHIIYKRQKSNFLGYRLEINFGFTGHLVFCRIILKNNTLTFIEILYSKLFNYKN